MRCVEGKVWQDPGTLFVINTDKLEHDNFMHTLANERNFLDSLAEIQDLNYMCLFLTPSLSGSNYYLCTMQYMHGDFVQRDSCHCATICTATAQCTSCMGHNVTKCTTGFIFLVQASSSQFICRARLPINRLV